MNTITELQTPRIGDLSIAGAVFRPFGGQADFAGMAAVINGSKDADGLDQTSSQEEVARGYRHLVNSDTARDMVMVDGPTGDLIGYGRVLWEEQHDGARLYFHFAHLLPEWRGMGIRRAMTRRNERRLREIAAGHPAGPKFYSAWASETAVHWDSLLRDLGYEAVRWGYQMVRPDLEGIPDLPLPEGLEVRPVGPEHASAIRDALNEAFQDSWGATEFTAEWLAEWRESPTFDPSLWQVAWAGSEIAGTVLPFINAEENEEHGRRRGYTEYICTRRPWRRQGVAQALIARALQAIKARGMEEAALGVDTQNEHGALRLYESLGFRPVRKSSAYRKPLDI